MLPLVFTGSHPLTRILCLGAHADDIELGCGGTILRLLGQHPTAHVRWVVLSGDAQRAAEARCGAGMFLGPSRLRDVVTKTFRDGFFPYVGSEIKEFFEELKKEAQPDLIFTHHRDDRHQDHRVVSELTWNTFRDHVILEYEIPKYDGGLGSPNFFVPLDDETRTRKVDHVLSAFGSQRDKRWFSAETFDAFMKLRGIECASVTGYAEAFHARKLTLG